MQREGTGGVGATRGLLAESGGGTEGVADVDADRAVVVGVDVGGTRVKSTMMTAGGRVLDERTVATPPDIGASLGDVVAGLVARHRRATNGAGPAAVGVVVPGTVDDTRGLGRWSANLGWSDLDVAGPVHAALGVPVAVSQDVRSGLVAERRFGAARGVPDVLFVPVGTGIAAAACVHGVVVTRPEAGEIGHVVVDPDGASCPCGRRGCLETVASARAIARRLGARTGRDPRALDAEHVARLVAGGAGEAEEVDAARAVWAEAVSALAEVVTPVVAAVGTRLLLVGGGLVRSGETLLAPLRTALAARGAGTDVVVAAATLGDRAGSWGACTLAVELVGSR